MKNSCRKCGMCCKRADGEDKMVIIYPSELNQMAEVLGVSAKIFLNKYCEKIQIECGNKTITTYILKHIGERCVFLTESNLCEIYDNRPIQCKKAPYEYFAAASIWNHMPCLDEVRVRNCDSTQQDRRLVEDLLNGYK